MERVTPETGTSRRGKEEPPRAKGPAAKGGALVVTPPHPYSITKALVPRPVKDERQSGWSLKGNISHTVSGSSQSGGTSEMPKSPFPEDKVAESRLKRRN